MADIVHDTHIEERRSGVSGIGVLIAFLIGGILIGALAVLLMNVHGTISWPAGRLDFNLPSLPPAQTTAAVPSNAVAVSTPAPVTTVTTTGNALSAAPATTVTVAPASSAPSVNDTAGETVNSSADANAAQPGDALSSPPANAP